MKIYEVGTGYTSIPARMGAATEIVVEELTKALKKSNIPVRLVDIQDKNRIPNTLPIIEVKVPGIFGNTDVALGIMHKLKRVVYSISLANKLKKMVKKEKDDVLIHFHNQYNMFFFLRLCPRKIRNKIKIAYTVHSYIWPKEWDEIRSIVKKKYFQEIACVKKADYVLVLNEKTKDHFVQHLGVDKNNIFIIKNGVNTEIYRPLQKNENNEFKRELGIEGKNYIFQVGSVCDRKNQLGIVKDLANYLKCHPEVVYIYAGGIIDSVYQEMIQEYAKKNGIKNQVIYAGELHPGKILNRYYSAANVSIFPSKLESFGMVIIESISSATHVLLAEQLLFNLSSGYNVYSGEAELENLLDIYMDKKIADFKGREEIIEEYSWEAVAKEHLAIWK